MKTIWTEVGREFSDTPEKREKIRRAISNLEWIDLSPGEKIKLPMMVAYGLDAVRKGCNMPALSKIAYSHEMAPFGLYAMQSNYKDVHVHVFIIDTGIEAVPVCIDKYFRQRKLLQAGHLISQEEDLHDRTGAPKFYEPDPLQEAYYTPIDIFDDAGQKCPLEVHYYMEESDDRGRFPEIDFILNAGGLIIPWKVLNPLHQEGITNAVDDEAALGRQWARK